MTLRPPNAANSEEEALEAFNRDLESMTEEELHAAKSRTRLLMSRLPDRWVWRGLDHLTVKDWGRGRLALIEVELREQAAGKGGR